MIAPTTALSLVTVFLVTGQITTAPLPGIVFLTGAALIILAPLRAIAFSVGAAIATKPEPLSTATVFLIAAAVETTAPLTAIAFLRQVPATSLTASSRELVFPKVPAVISPVL